MQCDEDVSLRPAEPDEAGALSELAIASKAHWGYSQAFLDACREELTYLPDDILAPQLAFWVARREGVIVGFYALGELSGQAVELEALFVAPALIGSGIGKRLVEHAKSQAAAGGAHTLVIQGDPNAAGFYRAAGGVLTGNRESGSIPGRFLPTFSVPLTAGRGFKGSESGL